MATTTNFGWETPDDTDLVKDGALAMRTLGNAIDASLVDLKGGTTGQVLSKTSNTDMDFTWVTSDDANAIQNDIVDAKGDLISASAADTPARLAVGNNGETLLADSSTSTGLRYNPQNALANPVLNGGMDIAQRGTSFTNGNSTAVYGLDRWRIFSTTSTGRTWSQQTVSDSTNLPNIQYAFRLARNSGDSQTNLVYIVQDFETVNSIPFAGKNITLSFYARAGANLSAPMGVTMVTGTGTDQNSLTGFSGASNAINTTQTLTTTWTRYAFTGSIGSTVKQLALQIGFVPTGTAGANDWLEVTGVQIDLGTYTASSAPTFRRNGETLAGELAACQRYYFRVGGDNLYSRFAQGFATSTGNVNLTFNQPVTMRIAPTSVDFSTLTLGDGVTPFTVTGLTIDQAGRNVTSFNASVASGLTQYRPYGCGANNSTSAFIAVSAEL